MEFEHTKTSNAENQQQERVSRKSATKAGKQQHPAVGFVATRNNTDALLREVLRATAAGHQVFVTHANQSDLEVLALAEHVGVSIVEPHGSDPNEDELKRELITTAKAHSTPGLIYNPDVTIPTDYATSTTRVAESDQYCVERIPAPTEEADVLVAIPAYNEAATIADVVTTAQDYADTVLVVDDGSTDSTAALARDAGAIVVEHDVNSGYGAALKTIFQEAKSREATHLVIIDADDQHDPADIPNLVEAQQDSEAEIVIGSRFTDDGTMNAPLYRRLGLFVVNMLTNLSFGAVRPQSWIGDTQSGFRAYNTRAIDSLANDNEIGDRMSASTDILHHAHTHGYGIEEIGTTVDYDVEDASSQHPLSHGLTLVSNILKTVERERPIMSLGVPGFLSSFIGIGFGYWTLANYVMSGTFPLGLAIISVFFGLAGIFACFTSIVLHSLDAHLY
ncbi:glycosyltransferase family 2 protein [Haloterrigena sp. H1]|uniref:glycosyltransferase family 2 protein n=1 Tax=Haloterrigena sp. H1 TaxID=2552943 RepID=UPI00110E0067|nr:glycosyltransferase family 2 protein [Haloterrigena sp. H1]TMT87009.1 glycosyltransferase family 2 protein [Haloterrigena sp. H1]